MNGYQNPYTDRRYGAVLSATRGFLDAYMQHQKIRYQMRQDERDWQYKQSVGRILTERRGLDIELLQRKLAFAKQHPEEAFGRAQFKIYSPTQSEKMREQAKEAWAQAETTWEGVDKKWWRSDTPRITRKSALQAEEVYKRLTGFEALNKYQKDQANFFFDIEKPEGADWPPPEEKPLSFETGKDQGERLSVPLFPKGTPRDIREEGTLRERPLFKPSLTETGQVPEVPGEEIPPQTTAGKEWTPDDTRYYIEPPPMRNKVTNWMALPEEVRKQIWLAYEKGWRPEEILKALEASKVK